MTSLRKKVKDLEIDAKKTRKDFDPEDDLFSRQPESDNQSENGESVDENAGREHYQAIGKSKLRKPEKIKLDEKKYGGSAVSRDKLFKDDDDADALAFEEDEDEDPFAASSEEASRSEEEEEEDEDEDEEVDHESENGSLDGKDVDDEGHDDEEIDSDEAFEDGEEDKFRVKGFVFRGSGKDLKMLPPGSDEDDQDDSGDESASDEINSADEDESDIDMEDVDEDEESDEENGIDDDLDDEEESEDEDESTAHPRPSTIKAVGTSDREKLRALISDDTAALASSLSASLSADAQKGAAVKKQYQTFDRLLDARIKLQKGLTASNDPILPGSITDEDAQTALRKAEEAALKLYATIESLRHSILEANSSNTQTDAPTKKRKHPTPPTLSTSTSDLWTRNLDLETQNLPIRRQILDKWSIKTRSAASISSTASKLTNLDQTQSKLSTVLDAYLHSESAKFQAASQSQTEPDSIIAGTPYDDSSFYQSLLRDLINSRAAANNISQQSNIPVLPWKLHSSGNTAKNRKVDTKASKGRKVRYTVHEKLENFMASEGRGNAMGQWNDGSIREFFASLLGQRGMLGESEGDGDEMDGDREVEALRLFRT